MAAILKMPHYPRGLVNEFDEFTKFMVKSIAERFKNNVLLALNKTTIEKFTDAQTGNYGAIYDKLAKEVTRKLIKQFSNERLEEYSKEILSKVNKYNQNQTYAAMEKVLGLNVKQLVRKEAMNSTFQALVKETQGYIKRLRDEVLQDFATNSLREMSFGRTIDEVVKNFDLSKSKKVDAARFIARNQVANFNAILTKIRHQKIGIKKGKWQTSTDDLVRRCHRLRHDKTFDLSKGCYSACDDKYLYPGEDYNCRCTYYAILDDFEEI